METQERIEKVAVKPRKPQGYESLFAKYQREKEVKEYRQTLARSDAKSHNGTTSSNAYQFNYMNTNDSNIQIDNSSHYNRSSKDMENPSENEDESEGDDEPALLDPSPKRKVVRSLFDELDFLDDFENFSDFDKHLKSANKEESEDAHDASIKLQKNPNKKNTKKVQRLVQGVPSSTSLLSSVPSAKSRPKSVDTFIESSRFKGAKKGFVFKMDKKGLGYYKDTYYRRPLSEPKRYRQDKPTQQKKQIGKNSVLKKKSLINKAVGPKLQLNSANTTDNKGILKNGIEKMLHSKGPSLDSTGHGMSLPQSMMEGVKLPKVGSLPKLRQELSKMRKMSSGIVAENSQIRAYSKRPSQREMDLNPNKPFDYAKLREAMEYAKKFEFQVNSAKLMEGANQNDSNEVRSKSSGSVAKTKQNRRKKGTSREHKILRDVYQNRRRMINGSSANRRGSKKGKKSNKKEKSNMESLVENFEKGIELQRLRAELEESKKSYYESNKFIENSQSWFHA